LIDWGDSSAATTIVLPPGDDTFSTTHPYLQNAPGVESENYAINALVTDQTTDKAGFASASVTVNKVAPQFTAGDLSLSKAIANEGDTIKLSGQFTDPDSQSSYTATVDWGDGSAPTGLSEQFGQIVQSPTKLGLYTYSATHQYLDNPPGELTGGAYEINVSVSDGVNTTSAATPIIVNNVPPTVVVTSAVDLSAGTITALANVTDPGFLEIESVVWTLTQNGIVIGTDTVSGTSYAFPIPDPLGVLVAAATVTDSDGVSGTGSAQLVVIYQTGASVVINSTAITVSMGGTAVATTTLSGAGQVVALVTGSNVVVNAAAATDPVELIGYGSSETLVGGAGDDLLVAGTGANSLVGGGGNDTLVSNLGDDTLVGGGGNDVFQINPGTDPLVVAPTGFNTLDFSIATSPVSINLGLESGQQQIVNSDNDEVTLLGQFNAVIGSPYGGQITANDANDLIYTASGNTTINGGAGSDSLVGGSGNDVIYLASGNTTLTGGSGTDSITGGSGNDIIYLASGNATVTGGSGSETIVGGSGNDVIYGNSATAIILGGSGNTSITGGSGDDIIVGGSGNDSITGGSGSDLILGGSGNDSIVGGSGDDTITGGFGNHIIAGGTGNDVIVGGTGNDSIAGGSGSDSITGGSGNDIIWGGTLSSTVTGSGAVTITFTGTSGNDSITGGSGDDTIFGGNGTDIIYGGTGDDTVVGGGGSDSILGGSGDDIIYGGAGDDSITGGPGDDIVYGGPGDNTISGGGGNITVVGGVGYDSSLGGGTADSIFSSNGNDVLEGSGSDSWLMDFGSQNMTITDSTLTTSGGGLPASVSTLSGFQNVLLAAGTGDFTLNASGFSGGAFLQGGTGDDTLIGARGPDTLEGGTGNDSLVGGGANDTFAFNSYSSGSQTIDEPQDGGVAGLDFSQAPAGISINLAESGPQAVMPATLNDGALTLTLADPLGIDSVLGSSYDDTIIGNANDNTLIGGGDDLIVGQGGDDLIEGSVTRTVYLDFDTYELPGQHFYTQAERDAIQAQITADYSAFSYIFTQTQPQSGPYTTITFNDLALVGLEGGVATEIDWRDLDISGETSLTAAGLEVIPADSAGVNVNNFLGGPGEPAASSVDFIGLSATIAAHELGHLSGLEHADSFGPIGSGIYSGVDPDLYGPSYPGPIEADETILHIMASGASVNSTLEDAINDPFFGERESIVLSYGEDGSPTNEELGPHYSMTDAQPIALQPLVVPDTDLEGVDADKSYDVAADDVVGYLGLNGSGQSDTDFYSFTAGAGTLINFQLMSAVLTRSLAPAGTPATDYNQGPFDTYLTIYNSSGQPIESNDNSFQDSDSSIIDLTLPYTGTYYAMVTSSPNSVSYHEPLSGDYELFMYTFATNGDPPAGDTLYGGSGTDTIIGGTADDTIAALPKDTIVYGSGTATLLSSAPYLDVTAGPNLTVSEGTSVTLTGSFIDPFGNATHTYDWHVVASSGQMIADGTGPCFTFSPGNAGTYTVTYTVSDTNGGGGSAVVVITSEAVRPILTAPASPETGLAGVNDPVNLGSLTVKGVGPWTDTVEWGDGQSSTFSPSGSGPLALAHTYATPGTYTIFEYLCEYDGDSTTASFSIKVSQTPTTNTFSSSALSSNFGEAIKLSAAVAPKAPGPGSPTGSVDFYDTTTATDLGEVSLSFGSASLSLTTLPVGAQTITETYSGDTDFTSSSASLSETVVISIYALNSSTPSPTITGPLYLSGSASISIPGQLVVDSPAKPAVTLTGTSKIVASAGVFVSGTV
jgi:Ca2+-binding RTX toxin-like protein